MSNFNVFGKNNPSISSSDRTNKIKNVLLFNNHIVNRNRPFVNHEYYQNLKNGFANCKINKKDISDNSNCFQVWVDDSSNNIIIHNVDDWKISKIDYSGVDFTDTTVLDISNSFWPYKSSNCHKTYYYNDYSFFDTSNNITSSYAKNFKYNLNRKSINL